MVARLRQRGRGAATRAVRLAGAAVAAYVIAEAVVPGSDPTLAPLTAVLVVQVTLFSTLRSGVNRVLSVVSGVVLAVVVSSGAGLTWWSLGLVVGLSVVIGQLLRLGDHLLEVPISAMLVLAVGGAEAAAGERISETLVGAAVGVAFNLLVPPAVQTRGAGDAVARAAGKMAGLLDRVAEELAGDPTPEQADQWLEDARRLVGTVARADQVLVAAEESRRFNPRTVGTVDASPELRVGLDAIEHCIVAVRGLCRALGERLRAEAGLGSGARDMREVLTVLLHDLAGVVRSFGRLVRAESRDVGGASEESELASALEALRETRVRVTELMLVDPQEDQALWALHGSLLTNVERILRELDIEQHARARDRLRGLRAQRAVGAQTVGRIRDTARQVAERTDGPRRRARAAEAQAAAENEQTRR